MENIQNKILMEIRSQEGEYKTVTENDMALTQRRQQYYFNT